MTACRSRSFKGDTYTVNTACQTALILQNKHSERWRAGDSWKLLNRHDGKHSARVCGAGLWKCFLRSSNRLHQNSIRVRGAPAAFFFHILLKIQSIKSKAGQVSSKTVQPPSNPEKFYCGIEEVGFWGGGGGGGGLRSGPSGGSLLPRARWTVLAGDTLMYELQFLLPLPLSTEKQVC